MASDWELDWSAVFVEVGELLSVFYQQTKCHVTCANISSLEATAAGDRYGMLDCETQDHQDCVARHEGGGTYPSFVGPVDVGSMHGVVDGILQVILFVLRRPDNTFWS